MSPNAGDAVATGEAERILSRLELLGVKLGLESTREILAQLGNPQVGLPVVLVAGTNGKGSTAAMIASIGTAAGYRTGLYTSPHLERVEERIRVDGREIAPTRLGELLERVVRAAEASIGHPPTYFEALTEAAYLYFAEEEVDLAVMETGLGGRLDATNAGEPVLSVITEIGFDHMLQLGSTLDRIAREKAGILRSGGPALAWAGADEPCRALRESAESLGAELEMVDDRRLVARVSHQSLGGQSVRLTGSGRSYDLSLKLGGRHQVRNLRLAVRSAERLADLGWTKIDVPSVERGIADCRWPGRLEWVATPGSRGVLLDAAHNPQAVDALIEFLEETDSRFDLLFGALEDKQIDAMLPPLAMRAERVTLTTPDSPRAAALDALKGFVAERRHDVAAFASPSSAMDAAWRQAGPLLVVCGSIYLVGEVRGYLRRRFAPAQLGSG